MMRVGRAMGIGLLLWGGLSGCQTQSALDASLAADHRAFNHLWAAYTRCVTSSDPAAARQQADLLHKAAYRESDSRTFLPRTLDQYVAEPPIRLAADPRDLALACRNHVDGIENAHASR